MIEPTVARHHKRGALGGVVTDGPTHTATDDAGGDGWGLLALEVMNISRIGGVLDTPLLFPRHTEYEAILKLTAGPSRVVHAEVVSSGADGLRLRWRHRDRGEAEALEDLLARCAEPDNADCWWELGWAEWIAGDWQGVIDAWAEMLGGVPGTEYSGVRGGTSTGTERINPVV